MELEFIDFEYGDVNKRGGGPSSQVNTNISIVSADLDGDALNVKFDYTLEYSPDKSNIRMSGMARFSGRDAKKAHDEFAKTSRITGAPGELIINAINYSATVNAVLLSKAFNLSPPLVLPTLKITK